ncbi:hypothetical protein BH23PSE1_BH23PSE1_16600 [soil metagenome]
MAKERSGSGLDRAVYGRLWRDWLRPYRRLVLLVFAVMIVGSAAAAFYAKLMQLVIAAFETADASVIWWGPLAVIGLTAAKGGSEYLKATRTNRIVTGLEADLQKRMFAQLVGTDLAQLQSEAPAGLAARFSSDIVLVSSAVKSIINGLAGILVITGTFAVMLSIDLALTLLLIGIFALAFGPVTAIGRKLKRLSRRTQAQVAGMTSEVAEGLAGIRMARTYQLEAPLAAHADAVFDALRDLKQRQNRWSARVSPVMEVLAGLAVAMLLLVVGWRMSGGGISLADFTGLLAGLGVAAQPARSLGGLYAMAQQG